MGLDSNSNNGYSRTSFQWDYVFDFGEYVNFCDDLINGTIQDYGINNLFTSWSDYIIKAQVFPFSLDNFFTCTATQNMFFGKSVISKNGYYLSINGSSQGAPFKKWCEFTLSKTFNNYLDYAPYTTVKLYLPFFELFDLPLEQCYKETIEVYLSIDHFTGDATAWLIGKTSGITLTTRTTKLSVELPIGKTNAEEKQRNNVLQAISAIGSGIGLMLGVESGNPLITAGSIGTLTKTTTSLMSNNVDRLLSYKGGGDSYNKWVCDKSIYLITTKPQHVTYPQYALKGGVCRKNLLLSGVTGYTEIGEIHFNPMGEEITDDEISEIIDLLRSGVIL